MNTSSINGAALLKYGSMGAARESYVVILHGELQPWLFENYEAATAAHLLLGDRPALPTRAARALA